MGERSVGGTALRRGGSCSPRQAKEIIGAVIMSDTDAAIGQEQAVPAAPPPAGAAAAAPGVPVPPPPGPAVPAVPPVTAPMAAAPVPQRPNLAGMIHHVELWVPDLDRAVVSWGWLLGALGYRLYQDWPGGRSWGSGNSYIVVEQSPARTASRHDRLRPGLNHLAFFAADRAHVDALVAEALLHGWKLMFSDKHPYAGGENHYAAYLENHDGYEVELVAAE
jgi:catechol 2,3-dioxygenase-like lactoylglutathione lyase family enzyme